MDNNNIALSFQNLTQDTEAQLKRFKDNPLAGKTFFIENKPFQIYIDQFLYRNNDLKERINFFNMPEGTKQTSSFHYIYTGAAKSQVTEKYLNLDVRAQELGLAIITSGLDLLEHNGDSVEKKKLTQEWKKAFGFYTCIFVKGSENSFEENYRFVNRCFKALKPQIDAFQTTSQSVREPLGIISALSLFARRR